MSNEIDNIIRERFFSNIDLEELLLETIINCKSLKEYFAIIGNFDEEVLSLFNGTSVTSDNGIYNIESIFLALTPIKSNLIAFI